MRRRPRPRRPRLATAIYVAQLLAGILITALAVRPNATLELLRHVWLEDLFGPLLVGAAGLTAAALILGVHSYRDRVGWGIFLVHVAWMLPTFVTFMAVYFMALRLLEMVVESGSLVLMAAAGAAGVALVWAAWRSRPVRVALQILKNRPRAWWMRMLVIFCCTQVVGWAAIVLWVLMKHGGLGTR